MTSAQACCICFLCSVHCMSWVNCPRILSWNDDVVVTVATLQHWMFSCLNRKSALIWATQLMCCFEPRIARFIAMRWAWRISRASNWDGPPTSNLVWLNAADKENYQVSNSHNPLPRTYMPTVLNLVPTHDVLGFESKYDRNSCGLKVCQVFPTRHNISRPFFVFKPL